MGAGAHAPHPRDKNNEDSNDIHFDNGFMCMFGAGDCGRPEQQRHETALDESHDVALSDARHR